MSATNHTPTLGLSQFLGGVDKPTWLGDYNSDMEKIDTSIHNLEIGTTSTIAAQIKILDTSVQELFKLDTEQTVKIAANTSSISNIQMNLTAAQDHIDSLNDRETLHNTATTAQLDSQKTILDDMTKNMNHFELNMNRIEDMAVLSTASVAKLEVRMAAAESDIRGLQNTSNDYSVDIDNLKTEIDTLETTTRLHDADINNAKRSLVVLTSSVAANQIALETYKEKTDDLISDIKTTSNNNATEITNIKNELSTTTNTANTVNTRTENIAEGVAVPFGFGIDAAGKYGYIPNNETTITPFATETDISGMRDEINETMADVGDLKTKTANITDGKALPYSLGITGNQYGYIPNGETGVVAFITRGDIESIVNLQPIQANITEIKNNIDSTNNRVRDIENNIGTTNNDVNTLRSEISQLENSQNDINSELTDLRTTNRDQDRNINQISSDIRNLQESITSLHNSITDINSNIDNIHGILTQTLKDVNSLKGRVDNLNTRTSGMVNRVEIPFSFGVDNSGNYGYKKTGSNTVTPFYRVP
jgi:chromosome segregation ATPase